MKEVIKLKVRNDPQNKATLFMRVSMDGNEENDKTSSKGPSTKYDHFMRVSMDENEENEKLQLRDHPQNTTTL